MIWKNGILTFFFPSRVKYPTPRQSGNRKSSILSTNTINDHILLFPIYVPFFWTEIPAKAQPETISFTKYPAKPKSDKWILLKRTGQGHFSCFWAQHSACPRDCLPQLRGHLHPRLFGGQDSSPHIQSSYSQPCFPHLTKKEYEAHNKGQNKTKTFHLFFSTKSPSHLKVKIHQEINTNQFQMKGACPATSVLTLWTTQGSTGPNAGCEPLLPHKLYLAGHPLQWRRKSKCLFPLQVMVRRKFSFLLDIMVKS